jgi:hypothetical protein
MDVAEIIGMTHVATETFQDQNSEIVVHLCRQAQEEDKEMMICVPLVLNESVVDQYLNFHKQYVNNALKKRKKFTLSYDLRTSSHIELSWITQFASLHERLENHYALCLRCTFILTSSGIFTKLINTVFSTVYKPVKPVKMVTEPMQAIDFINMVESNVSKQMPMYSSVC